MSKFTVENRAEFDELMAAGGWNRQRGGRGGCITKYPKAMQGHRIVTYRQDGRRRYINPFELVKLSQSFMAFIKVTSLGRRTSGRESSRQVFEVEFK